MMILEDYPERAIWIDFDRPRTYDGELSDEQKRWIAIEKSILEEIAGYMVCGRLALSQGFITTLTDLVCHLNLQK